MTQMFDDISNYLRRLVGAMVVGCLVVGIGTAANAAVIIDPTLFTGPDSIDPVQPDTNAGVLDTTIVAGGAASKATLTSQPTWGVIQNFNGFTSRTAQGAAAGVPAVNYFAFTDPNRPDVKISSLSGNGSGGGGDSNASTSGATVSPPAGTTDQYLGSNVTTGGFSQTLEFGTYDTSTNTFVADQTVSSIGFMVTRINNVATNWTATYYDASGNVLETQTTGTVQAVTTVAAQFGRVSSSADIRRVTIVFQGAVNTFFDDLGYTAVPEPSTALLVGVGVCGLWAHRRRGRIPQ